MTSLSAQLGRLQHREAAHTLSTDKAKTDSEHRRIASLIFSQRDARAISREQLHEMALVGLRVLVAAESRLHRHAAFLFSDAHVRKERSMFTAAESMNVISPAVSEFLALLAPQLMVPAMMQVLEYLVRVFEIHEHDAAALLRLVLPAHDQGLFVRVLYITNLDGTGFEFLNQNKSSGTVLPRAALVTAARENPKVLALICGIVTQSLQRGVHNAAGVALFTYVASALASSAKHTGGGDDTNNEHCFRMLLPHLIEWLAVKKQHTNANSSTAASASLRWELSAASRIVLMIWANESRFSADIILVITSTVGQLIRSVASMISSSSSSSSSSHSNNGTIPHTKDGGDDVDDSTKEMQRNAIRESYRLLAHICNTQCNIIIAAGSSEGQLDDGEKEEEDGRRASLLSSLAKQIVSLPFDSEAMTSFARASPWALHRLVLKYSFENIGNAAATEVSGDNDNDITASSGGFFAQYLERCFSFLPLTSAHVMQCVMQLARTAATEQPTMSKKNNTLEFVARSVSVLERRFPAFLDLAIAELLRSEIDQQKQQQQQVKASTPSAPASSIMTDFVMRFCSGTKYNMVDLSSAAAAGGKQPRSGSLVLPLIGALVHPVPEVRRIAAMQLHSASSASTFRELRPLLLHIVSVETEPAVLGEVVKAIATHINSTSAGAVADDDAELQDEAGSSNNNNKKRQETEAEFEEKKQQLALESFRAVMRFAPALSASNSSNSNQQQKIFLSLLAALSGLFFPAASKQSSKPSTARKSQLAAASSSLGHIALCCRVFIQALAAIASQGRSSNQDFLRAALEALGMSAGDDNNSNTNINLVDLTTEVGWAQMAKSETTAATLRGCSPAWVSSVTTHWLRSMVPGPESGKRFKSVNDFVERIGGTDNGAATSVALLVDAAAMQVATAAAVLSPSGNSSSPIVISAITKTLTVCQQVQNPRRANNGNINNNNKHAQQQQSAEVASAFLSNVGRLLLAPICVAVVVCAASSPKQQLKPAVAMASLPVVAAYSCAGLESTLLPSLLSLAGQREDQHTIAYLLAASIESIVPAPGSGPLVLVSAVRAAGTLFGAVGGINMNNNNNSKSAKATRGAAAAATASSSASSVALVCTALLETLDRHRREQQQTQQSAAAPQAAHQLHLAFSAAQRALETGLLQSLTGSTTTTTAGSADTVDKMTATLCLSKLRQLASGSTGTAADTPAAQQAVFAATVHALLKDLFQGSSKMLAASAPSLFRSALLIVAEACASKANPLGPAGAVSSWSTPEIAALLSHASTFALVLSASEQSATTMPLEALAAFAKLAVDDKQQQQQLAKTLIVDTFLQHETPLRINNNNNNTNNTSQTSSSPVDFRFVFPAELVVSVLPQLVISGPNKDGLKKITARLLQLHRRGCGGVTAAICRSPLLFEALVNDLLSCGNDAAAVAAAADKNKSKAKKIAQENNSSSEDRAEMLAETAECVKLALQQADHIRQQLEASPDHAQQMVSSVLRAAEFCIKRAREAAAIKTGENDDDAANGGVSHVALTAQQRATLIDTANAALIFVNDFCGSRVVVSTAASSASSSSPSVIFFLDASSEEQLKNWYSLILSVDASVAHAALRLVESAVTVSLGTKQLGRAALNLLAHVVLNAFNNSTTDSATAAPSASVIDTRFSPTPAVQRLVKILLPALTYRVDATDSTLKALVVQQQKKKCDDDDDDAAVGGNDDDDDDDAPPMIFTRGGAKPTLSKYQNAGKSNKQQHQQQQMAPAEDQAAARALAQRRKEIVAETFERAKQNLSVPILALLVRMREVATSSQLRFQTPDALLCDIVCSFDILDQMACFRGVLELWHEAMLHPQGFLVASTISSTAAITAAGAADNKPNNANNAKSADEDTDDVFKELRTATDMRPFVGHIASFLRVWSEDQRFIDAFVRANTSAFLTASTTAHQKQQQGGGGGSISAISRHTPTLAPFCDAVFSALNLFQFYKLAPPTIAVVPVVTNNTSNKNKRRNSESDGDDDNGSEVEEREIDFVDLVGNVLATLLSMVDEELFVICIREIVLNRVSPRVLEMNNNINNNSNKSSSLLQAKSATAARRIGLEILCDRLALTTTLGGSSARYTNKKERIARGATAILSERCAQRLFDLLHRLLKEHSVEADIKQQQKHLGDSTSVMTLEEATEVFNAACAAAGQALNVAASLPPITAASSDADGALDAGAAASARGGGRRARDAAGQDAQQARKKPNASSGAAAREAEEVEQKVEDAQDEEDQATDNNNNNSVNNTDNNNGISSYRGLLRRRLLAVPTKQVLDVQWTVLCCEEAGRCFGSVKGDQLALTVGTLARIGLDAICFRGNVFPTVPAYRNVAHIKTCAWGNTDDDNDDVDVDDVDQQVGHKSKSRINNNNNNNINTTRKRSRVVAPTLMDADQIVLVCSVVTAVSNIAATLGPARMVSAAGNDALNLLTTALRYSARLSHRFADNNNNNGAGGGVAAAVDDVANKHASELHEAIRQLRHCALEGLRRALPATWTLVEPFLPQIISSVTARSLAEEPGTSSPARELLAELDGLLEPRVLFPCIADALQQSHPTTHSFALLFQVVQNLVGRLSKAEVKQIPSLMNCELFTVAFDKFAGMQPSLPPMDTLRAAFGAFASFAVKFREATCASLCSNIVVWGTNKRTAASAAAGSSNSSISSRTTEIQRWTLTLALFEYMFERLGAVADFAFSVVSPVIVDTLTALSSTSPTAPRVHQQRIVGCACLEMAFACARRIADIANEAAESTNTATDSADTPEPLLPYFSRQAPFEALCGPLCAQLGNVAILSASTGTTENSSYGAEEFGTRAEQSLLPCLRSVFKSLRNPQRWSKMQQALIRNLRQPAMVSRLATLSLLRLIYADGGDTLASLVLAEALPAIVEATEDSDAKVADEARLLCKELTTVTGQDVLEYMTA